MKHDLDILRSYLAVRRGLWSRIAEESGVARRAIAYIVDDVDRDPRVSTVTKLFDWIRDHDPGTSELREMERAV